MALKGIKVDVNYCTGCKACVIACQQEHNFDADQYGIVVFDFGPMEIAKEYQKNKQGWEYDFFPQFTHYCDLCEERVHSTADVPVDVKGRPTCVDHCQSRCLKYGDIEELAKECSGPRQYIWAIKEED